MLFSFRLQLPTLLQGILKVPVPLQIFIDEKTQNVEYCSFFVEYFI